MNAFTLLLKLKLTLVALICLLVTLKFCCPKEDDYATSLDSIDNRTFFHNSLSRKIKVSKNVIVKNYFQFLDSVIIKYDPITPYKLDEHFQLPMI